ncbi:hypothetical protein [Blastococcus capsensis]|uniref:hypothetical protein n=1 Tax=Blastococcus capsensis TaxID=1564163 RepID=UPI002540408D|nr:hypothetical protein [Blastococcus capsensis]MDK3257030.1 hypothetical protein [Blastococcus capsensis]
MLLGESTHVRRLLPTLGRRMVGAWVFVDHYGPDDIATAPGMQVAPHPHTGLLARTSRSRWSRTSSTRCAYGQLTG